MLTSIQPTAQMPITFESTKTDEGGATGEDLDSFYNNLESHGIRLAIVSV